MPTDFNPGNVGQGRKHFAVHRLDGFNALGPAAHVGLVCNYHQDETLCVQARTTFRHVRVEFEVLDSRGRTRTAFFYNWTV